MDRRTFLTRTGLFAVTTMAGGQFLMSCAPGSSQSESADGLQELVFVTPFQHILTYSDVYVAIQEGYFEAEGLRVEPVGGTGTASSASQILAGQGTFGKAAAVVTCPMIADQGADIITVAVGDQVSQYSVASSPDNPLTHPNQWQGKTIGVISKGGATELLLDAMSVAVGLDPGKVSKVVTGSDVSSLEFLERGEVDGFITFIGSETALRKMGKELHYLNTDEFAKMPGDSYFVKRSDLDEQGDAIAGFLRASRKGFEFVADPENEDKVISAMAAYNKTEVSDTELAKMKIEGFAKLSTPKSGDFLDIDMAAWESAIELMRKSGIIEDTERPLSDFVTTSVLERL
ncbi:ABC transporter substrate-binding protein [Prauserella cavernicola]|uniref:Thiamine pyrimidine synthase n=1 Tax=Prauserella cavernicola TaxID=2800127 RepID=A0A934R1N0_9PSEU|nr:ABC transporter substrate-binding protein [Prauserella cavernicola]MBK1789188.1 ABC transporter substrate-binding protein [Prauserella cavernicola]